jgi:TonB family protein
MGRVAGAPSGAATTANPAPAQSAPPPGAAQGAVASNAPERAVPTPQPTPRARRHTLVGRSDADIVAMMYAEKWRQRVELNGAFDILKRAKAGNSYENPVVTVALRSDGSVEGVTFNRSSGNPEIDNAIRQIVTALGPYAPFPRDLAMDYDVIEIRRIWSFDTALRLFSGGR